MGDNINLQDRDGVRTPMQWDGTQNAGFSKVASEKLYSPVIDDQQFGFKAVNVKMQINDSSSLYSQIKEMIVERKRFQAFGKGTFQWVSGKENPALAVFWRTYRQEKLLVLHNLSGQPRKVDLVGLSGMGSLPKLVLGHYNLDQTMLDLEPYGFAWLDYSKV